MRGTVQITITLNFELVDEDLLDQALEDLKEAQVWAEDEGPQDNTVEENVDILVEHLDVLAQHRGVLIDWEHVGLKRLPD